MPVRVGAKRKGRNDRKISSNGNGRNAHVAYINDIGVWGMNELLEIIKGFVTDEMIKEAVYEVVDEKFTRQVNLAIESKAKEIAERYCDKKINEALQEIFNKPVIKSDGWSASKQYKSFEEFVKGYVQDQICYSEGLERQLRMLVGDHLRNYCIDVLSENKDDMTRKVFEKIAKENA